MMSKAVFIDHKEGELDPKLFARMKKNFAKSLLLHESRF